MVPAALLPAIALIAGGASGIAFALPWHPIRWLMLIASAGAIVSWWRHLDRLTVILIAIGFGCAGLVLGSQARDEAIETPLRRVLDREFGGFLVDAANLPAQSSPVTTRVRLTEDASTDADGSTLRADVIALRLRGEWHDAEGGVVLSVGGASNEARAASWRRGRTLEAPVTFRRPARFLDEGVPDFERQAALDGISLLGSIKSGLLVTIVARGTLLEEEAADVRAYVRHALTRHVAPHGAVSAAIVDAVLIGDRSGLPDEVRTRLQAAGTYHVIAISGGNIAILAGVIILLLSITSASGRTVAAATLLLLVAYAELVTAGPSVWRATFVAAAYLVARLLDHRSAPWQAMALAGALIAVTAPLDVRNAGFILTFGATAALLEVARRHERDRGRARAMRPGDGSWTRTAASWVAMSVATSFAVEVVLLPVMAATFSRVTAAGIVLNLIAVPAMAVVQVAGMIVVAVDRFEWAAWLAGWVAHFGAAAIVDSARLVDVAPWLAIRVPPPAPLVVIGYYGALAALLTARRTPIRAISAAGMAFASLLIILGTHRHEDVRGLRLTMIDVGQGDAMVLQSGAATLTVDAGGSPFGGGGFDIGSRVVEPALWARGIASLDTMLFTHGDPDHIGGAPPLVADFHPREVWQGIPVARATSLRGLLARAVAAGAHVIERREGEELAFGAARILVLHPEAPDWERQKVRNDDSVVLEVIDGDVGLLLTGDIGSEVERELIPRLVPTTTRILKVAHHGSRTSTSQAFLTAWKPQVALISAGRGNPFGHPAPDVVARLEASGAVIYRTDRDGEITLETDGERVVVRTFSGDVR